MYSAGHRNGASDLDSGGGEQRPAGDGESVKENTHLLHLRGTSCWGPRDSLASTEFGEIDLGETEQEGERGRGHDRFAIGAENQAKTAGWCEVTAFFPSSQFWGLEFGETSSQPAPPQWACGAGLGWSVFPGF